MAVRRTLAIHSPLSRGLNFNPFMPRRPARECTLPVPFTRSSLLAAGFSVAELRGWLARGEVKVMQYGLYAAASIAADPVTRAIYASAEVADGRAVVPLLGAAALHGIRTPPQPHPSHLRVDGRRRPPDEVIVNLRGLAVHNAAWTAVQLARWQGLAGALICFDSALANGVQREELLATVDRMQGWPGVKSLRRAVEEADARSESAFESWSRGLMIDGGLPRPTVQLVVRAQGLNLRADFAWPHAGVLGEADGMAKYGDADDARRAIFLEKRRQAALQAAGWLLHRWTWKDVYPQHGVWLAGLRTALQDRRGKRV